MKLTDDAVIIKRKPRRRLLPSVVPVSLGLILGLLIFVGVSSLFSEGFGMQRSVGILVIASFFLLSVRSLVREWLVSETIFANVLDVTIQQRLFAKVLNSQRYPVILMSPLFYREWIVNQYDGAGYKESGVCFEYLGETVTCALGVTEMEGWEIVDEMCAATGLQSTEKHAPSPAVVNFLPS